MSKFEQCMIAIDYSVNDSSRYCWSCYGRYAQFMDFSFGHAGGNFVYDMRTREIYEITVNFEDDRMDAYRWINPEYRTAHMEDAKSRGVDYKAFCDGYQYSDTDSFDDILDKITKIRLNQPFDERVVMEFELDDDILFILMKDAHKKDMTFNNYMKEVLNQYIEKDINEET